MHDARVFEVVLCPALIGEVRDVLSRPKITRLVADGLAEAFLDDVLRAAGDLYPDPAAGSALTRDADDDYLIALAREAGADAIVTGDRDLLDWPEQIPPVMTPAEFETRLSGR